MKDLAGVGDGRPLCSWFARLATCRGSIRVRTIRYGALPRGERQMTATLASLSEKWEFVGRKHSSSTDTIQKILSFVIYESLIDSMSEKIKYATQHALTLIAAGKETLRAIFPNARHHLCERPATNWSVLFTCGKSNSGFWMSRNLHKGPHPSLIR